MTSLLVYLEPSGADAAYPWALRSPDGRVTRRGTDPLRALPQAKDCIVILPWHRAAVHRVRLPAASRERLQGALHYAIENDLLGDPAATYVAIAGQDAAGVATLVSTDRPVLAALLQELREKGVQVSRMIAEALAVPVAPRGWSVVPRDDGGFVRTGPHGGFTLDQVVAESPPVQLKLSLGEASAAGNAPSRLLVYRSSAQSAQVPWREALGIATEDAGAWNWEASDAASSPDLLQGDLRPRTKRLEALRPWIPAGVFAGAILAAHVAFTFVHWASLSWENNRITRDMEAVFRQAAPDARAIVDPPLQLRRILSDLRRASGAIAEDDFLALLGRTAPQFQHAAGTSVRSIEYASGSMRVDLLVPRSEVAAEFVQQLTASGLRARLESSSASGTNVMARISVGGASR